MITNINIIITLYYHKTKNYILSQTQQLSLSTMLNLLRMFYISAAFFPVLREVSISRTNSVPLVGRKLLRQAGQSHTVLVILLLWYARTDLHLESLFKVRDRCRMKREGRREQLCNCVVELRYNVIKGFIDNTDTTALCAQL